MTTALNDPQYIEMRDRHMARLSAIFGARSVDKAVDQPADRRDDQPAGGPTGRPRDQLFILNGIYGSGQADPYTEPELWVNQALESLVSKVDLLRDQVTFRPLAVEYGPYGVHFIDRILGAEVYVDETSRQWYNRYCEHEVGELAHPDLDSDSTWRLAKRAALEFVRSGAKLPYFGLPTLSSALNTAVNIYGEQILVAMYERPEAARRDLQIITDLICELHVWYRANIPFSQLQPVVAAHRTQPPGFGQICGCTTQLVSPSVYRDMIAPLDDQVLSVYPNGGMIHLCGSHTQHIPWRDMKSLRAVQLNDRAALDLEAYFHGLRDDQIIYANLFDGMPLEKVLEITGGERVVIVGDVKRCLLTSCDPK